MGIPDIPADKAELLSVLLEAVLYGKRPLMVTRGGKYTDDCCTRFLVVDVWRDDLGTGVSALH